LSFLSSKGKLVLLHKGLKELKKASKYDFVLSPQFYIAKREKLPVKYAFQAKKLAPSILEDSLPTEYGYEYLVQKDGEYWQLFAYSPKEIEEYLKSCCNLNPNKIGTIYFADQLNGVLKKLPVGIDEFNALTLIDNKATIVPRSMLESDRYAKFTSRLRPKNGYSFKASSKSSRDTSLNKSVIVASILMIFLGGIFILEGFNYKKALLNEEFKTSDLLSNYPSLQGKLIRDSIKSKYEDIEKKERSIRNLLDIFSQLTSKKSLLDKLELKDNKLVAQFSVSPQEMKKIISIATTAKLKATKVNNNLLHIEGVIK